MPLTVKDEVFARASLSGMSNREAAIAAGCPEGTASTAGSRFARKPEVIEFIADLKRIEAEESGLVGKSVDLLPASTVHQGDGEIPHLSVVKPKAVVEPTSVLPAASASGLEAQENQASDSLAFLRDVMNDKRQPMAMRLKASMELAKYEHARVAPQGKKEGLQDAAGKAGRGRFGTQAPPDQQASFSFEEQTNKPRLYQ